MNEANAVSRPQNQLALRLVRGVASHASWPLSAGTPATVTVGSGAGAEWRVVAEGLADRHAMLRWTGQALYVVPIGPTRLRGVAIDAPAALAQGDLIEVGAAIIAVEITGGPTVMLPVEAHERAPSRFSNDPHRSATVAAGAPDFDERPTTQRVAPSEYEPIATVITRPLSDDDDRATKPRHAPRGATSPRHHEAPATVIVQPMAPMAPRVPPANVRPVSAPAPVSHAPVSHAPVSHAPVAHAAVGHSPVAHSPVAHAPHVNPSVALASGEHASPVVHPGIPGAAGPSGHPPPALAPVPPTPTAQDKLREAMANVDRRAVIRIAGLVAIAGVLAWLLWPVEENVAPEPTIGVAPVAPLPPATAAVPSVAPADPLAPTIPAPAAPIGVVPMPAQPPTAPVFPTVAPVQPTAPAVEPTAPVARRGNGREAAAAEPTEPPPPPTPEERARMLRREAVALLAANRHAEAAQIYAELSQLVPTDRSYAVAAHILRNRAAQPQGVQR